VAKPLFKKVCIFGVGLIGGSLGMAIKRQRLAEYVVGCSHKILDGKELAQKRRAVDEIAAKPKEAVVDADLIILAMPVLVNLDWIKKMSSCVKSHATVIDVGSTKNDICETARKHLKKAQFVGCHPMAGSEKRGVEFARADLFKGATCFLTANNQKIQDFWKRLGAKPLVIDAKAHDAWTSRASHLPHLLAFNLFQDFLGKKIDGLSQINPSLRDFARLAKSNPKIWANIFLSNKDCLLESLTRFEKNLARAKKLIERGSVRGLQDFISNANKQSGIFTHDSSLTTAD
jgi:prephenate dehydrogenase